MSLSATLFGRDSAIFKATNILGLGIPGWLDKKFGAPETEGPRLSDLSVQTSTYGAPIARIYGTVGGMGNLIWLENNKLKETVRKKKSGGKGGGGSSEPTKTYSYSATFHIALCEGPIAGIRRIWCGDKLIYNAGSDDLETIIASNKAAKGWKLYLGTDDQMPDPRYEAEYGVGNVSAHRGLAYIAFYDFKLADYSNTLQAAQFKVEVRALSTDASFSPVNVINSAVGTDDDSYNSGHNPVSADGFWLYSSVNAGTQTNWSARFDGTSFQSNETVGYKYLWNINNNHAYPGGFPFGICVLDGAGTRRYYRVGDNYYEHPSISGFFGLDSSFVHEDNLYYSNLEAGVNTIYKLPPADGFFGTVVGSSASNVVSVNERAIFYSGGYACMVAPSNTINRYDIDTLEFVDSVVVPGATFPNTAKFTATVDSDGYIYIFDCFSGDEPSHVYFRSDFSGEAVAFSTFTDESAIRYVSVSFGLIGVVYLDGSAVKRRVFRISSETAELELLSDIVIREIEHSSLLLASDIDVSLLSSQVRGYRVSGGTIRAALEPLQSAFPFDVRAHGYQIQFLPRGQASVATIPWEDLGASAGDTPDSIFPQSREMDTQLPAKTVVKYLDAAREYAIGEQLSERLNTEAVNKVERDLAIVLNADEAAGIAEMLNFLPWLERTPASFTLPPPYRYLEAGDVVEVVSLEAVQEIRLLEVNETQDGRLECKAVPNRAALYTPAATGAEGVPPAGTIGLAGESLFVPLDIPVIDETLQNAPGFVGAMTGYNAGWPGGLAVRSIDDGQTWSDLQAYNGKATIGTTQDVLPASDCTLIDQRSLLVYVISGEFESVTRDQMLAGINYAAYGIDGRWEIVRFQNATLQADASYLISGFVRGEKGTEWASGLHAAGDYFILLDDPDNAFIGMAVGSIAVPATYRGVTSGASVDDATDVPFTYQGVNLECLSPVYAKGARDGSNNFTGTFTRRSRLSSSWWANGVAAPVGEASESYEVDVMDGAVVARTITAATPAFAYSAADQTTDFGSPQSAITFSIYQISDTMGRGYPYEVTL